ncbi:hypothetical protein AVEN_70984-1 [Araneus ventricosus]|uniref:Peptidase A2 domain-containing protein n=1 Tax=Araneus ventricosus TaxID=182803 RepID=A0A4Y2KNW5_ARAVE|nr:hypothetical protein AVEN_70984-1 [Araneus ventricosus]
MDTGANVTLVRTDLAQKLKDKFFYTAPNISLKTDTGEKTEIHGKLDAAIGSGSRKFQHRIYVADITDPCILGLDFLQKFNFTGVPEVSGQFRYAVTDFPRQVSKKVVLVASTLADLKRGAIPVRVLNLDNKPKTVDKGAVITTCELVLDILARPQVFFELLHLPSILENIEELIEEQRTTVGELHHQIKNFRNCFLLVGRCNMTQNRINRGNHPPIRQYPRRLPLAKKEEAERIVKEMVDNGIIGK